MIFSQQCEIVAGWSALHLNLCIVWKQTFLTPPVPCTAAPWKSTCTSWAHSDWISSLAWALLRDWIVIVCDGRVWEYLFFLLLWRGFKAVLRLIKCQSAFLFFFFFNFFATCCAMTIYSFIYSFKCYFVTMACQNHSEDVDVSVEDVNVKLTAPSLHGVGCIKM